MVWCLGVAILSLIISQGADGEPDSRGSGAPCWPWGGSPPGGKREWGGRAGPGDVAESLSHFAKPGGALRATEERPLPALTRVPAVGLPHLPGRGKPEVVSVVGRAGETAVLGCDLLPPAGRPPLHVIEWLRFGFLLPIFIQFGLYSPRIDPDYVGKTGSQVGRWEVLPPHQGWWGVGGGQDSLLLCPPPLSQMPLRRFKASGGGGRMGSRVGGSVTRLLLQWGPSLV